MVLRAEAMISDECHRFCNGIAIQTLDFVANVFEGLLSQSQPCNSKSLFQSKVQYGCLVEKNKTLPEESSYTEALGLPRRPWDILEDSGAS